jgi:hypothetical protein
MDLGIGHACTMYVYALRLANAWTDSIGEKAIEAEYFERP